MDDSTDAFDCIVDQLEYPMFVVAAAVEGDADACLVGFTTQCSIEPSRFVACLSKVNHTFELASQADVLTVHRLRAEQHELAEHFGGVSAHDDPNKLAGCQWAPGPEGAPVIDGCDWFAGRIVDRLDVGDHVAFVVAPFAGDCRETTRYETAQLGAQEAFDIEAGRPAS